MQRGAWRAIIYSQLVFYIGIIICVLLRPDGLIANSGVSYYGTFLSTVIPYSFGLLGAAYFSWQAARKLQECEWLAATLRVGSILLIGIVATPYTVSTGFDWLHTIFGSLLFIVQLVATAKLAILRPLNWTCLSLWLLELTGGVISAIYVAPSHGYLVESQLLFQLAYGSLIVYVLRSATLATQYKARYGTSSNVEAQSK